MLADQLWELLLTFDLLVFNFSVITYQLVIKIYRRGNFVYQHSNVHQFIGHCLIHVDHRITLARSCTGFCRRWEGAFVNPPLTLQYWTHSSNKNQFPKFSFILAHWGLFKSFIVCKLTSFINHHWVCILIYSPLSYPLGSLCM